MNRIVEELTSTRTVLRPFMEEDQDELLALFRDPSVLERLGMVEVAEAPPGSGTETLCYLLLRRDWAGVHFGDGEMS